MYKKVICILACFVMLLLPSCKGAQRANPGNGVACPIEGLEWGMSAEECLAALSLTEEEVQIERDDNPIITTVTISAELPDYEQYGFHVKGVALYLLENYIDLPVGLYQIAIHFDPSPGFEELQVAVKSEVQAYTVDDPENPLYASYSQTYNSPKTLADADPELADKYFPISEWYKSPFGTSNVTGLPEKEDYPYGSVTVQSIGDTSYVLVNNWVATVMEQATGSGQNTSK